MFTENRIAIDITGKRTFPASARAQAHILVGGRGGVNKGKGPARRIRPARPMDVLLLHDRDAATLEIVLGLLVGEQADGAAERTAFIVVGVVMDAATAP